MHSCDSSDGGVEMERKDFDVGQKVIISVVIHIMIGLLLSFVAVMGIWAIYSWVIPVDTRVYVFDRRLDVIDPPTTITPAGLHAGKIYHFPPHDMVTLHVTLKTLDGGRLPPSDVVGIRVHVLVSVVHDPAPDEWVEYGNQLIDTNYELSAAPHEYAAMRLVYHNESDVTIVVSSYAKVSILVKQ
jgi:hypothetical protein